ncbi:MDR family MFS transporter [Tomitella biformata]|uniref:MDR family MFS transporter n=1 Tax=Tomitella biformata TaxID=630403 RepID=UPI0004655AFB|nr:MDR family MFS transporter [Tomitella biformata]
MTESAAVAGTEGESPAGLSHRAILLILSGLMLGMFLASLDQTIVSTAIRTIADELNGYALQAWVTTAYLITSTLATPLYGKISDIYGRKLLFMSAIVIFLIGSALCSFSTSMYMLAAFRALQGVGAGGLMSLALAILGDILAPRERAKYQAYFLAVFGTSSVLGPVLGGVFAGHASILGISGWRWVFLVNVPIGFIALAVVFKNLHLPKVRNNVRIDWWGAATLTLGLVPLLIVAEQGRIWGWSSALSWTCYLLGAVGVVAFVLVEIAMKDAALIPMGFFRNKNFALGVAISFVVGMAMFGGIMLLPQYLQVAKGSSPTIAGLQMLPLVLGLMVGSIASGIAISKTGHYRIYPIIGSTLLVIGMFLLHLVRADTSFPVVMGFMLIVGVGLGNMMQPLVLAIQNALPAKDMGVSTASATFFRQIGGTLGVAIFLSILFAQITPSITSQLETATQNPQYVAVVQQAAVSGNPVDKAFAQGLLNKDSGAAGSVLEDSSIIQKLSPELAKPLADGFADAMDEVFLATTGFALIAWVLVLFWKEVPLRESAGLVAAKGEAEDGPDPSEV